MGKFPLLLRYQNYRSSWLGRSAQWSGSRNFYGRAVIPSILATGYALYFPAKINLHDSEKKD